MGLCRRCVQALRAEADGKALLLLDELGTGTDPVEGAALGVALLRRLVKGEREAAPAPHLNAFPCIHNALPASYLSRVHTGHETEKCSGTCAQCAATSVLKLKGRQHARWCARAVPCGSTRLRLSPNNPAQAAWAAAR